jgi:hypothetical protein
MANTTHIETAKIYQFPVTARASYRGQPMEATVMILERKSNRFADAAYGGSWYHDAAIEAEQKPKS